MNKRIALILMLLLPFSALTLYALAQVGYIGIFEAVMTNAGGWQVLADLVVVCILAATWMIADARARGITVWPFLLITLSGGSFGPLLYLLWRELRSDAPSGALA